LGCKQKEEGEEKIMAWYEVNYSCGHSDRIQLYGKHTEREKRIKYLEGTLCPDCYWKKIQEETKQTTKEFEMPELTGTPKQVQWANTIRADTIKAIVERKDEYVNKSDITEFDEILGCLISNFRDAGWWIDSRNVSNNSILAQAQESLRQAPKREAMKTVEAEALEEATVYPEKQIISTPATIEIRENTIYVFFEKELTLINLMKLNKYKWNGSKWAREIVKTNGAVVDRAAEIGNKLLLAGAPIRIINNEARQKAIDGTYEKEHLRWISRQINSGRLVIRHELSDYLYNQSKQITGAKYDKDFHAVIVDPMYYEEINIFAKTHGFRFTDAAQEQMDKERQARENAKTIRPVAPKGEEIGKEGEILDDLLDEK